MEETPKVRGRVVGKQDVRTPEQKKIATIEKVYYDNGISKPQRNMESSKGIRQQHHRERRQEVEGNARGTEEASIWLQLVHPIKALRRVPDRPVVFHQGRKTRTKGRGQEARQGSEG